MGKKIRQDSNRILSTVYRHNMVHKLYNEIYEELGKLKPVVARGYVYEEIAKRTGLTVRRISYIVNHTRPQKTDLDWD